MWNHESIWAAIDALAAKKGLSASGLAKKGGLDPTAFNPSKRHGADGRPRWPSTESIAKILAATGESLDNFVGMAQRRKRAEPKGQGLGERLRGLMPVPLLGLAQAGAGGFFDDGGFPAGKGWDEVTLPGIGDETAYALQVAGESMQPLYRHGDIIIVSPAAKIRRGDRVVVRTKEGEVMAKILKRRTAKEMELASLNPDHAERTVPAKDVDWVARILWASQ
jgi:phage repressor protein C with HTH and peptisase S24 domain